MTSSDGTSVNTVIVMQRFPFCCAVTIAVAVDRPSWTTSMSNSTGAPYPAPRGRTPHERIAPTCPETAWPQRQSPVRAPGCPPPPGARPHPRCRSLRCSGRGRRPATSNNSSRPSTVHCVCAESVVMLIAPSGSRSRRRRIQHSTYASAKPVTSFSPAGHDAKGVSWRSRPTSSTPSREPAAS